MMKRIASMSAGMKLLAACALAVVLAGGVYLYVHAAYPPVRCEAVKHVDPEDRQMAGDCYGCHAKATPKVAQNWYESKHGVALVKCFVCHGQPDGKGAVVFAAVPDVDTICRRCHDPAIRRMEAKFGQGLDCNACHPMHQNSMHHEAYGRTVSKTTFE
ncbi:MAG: hypothetical protein ACK5JO_11040 [Halodesulfovibrio sp.]